MTNAIPYYGRKGLPDRLKMIGQHYISGSQAVTTNASGVVTINHDLGRTPTFASVETFTTSWRATVTARSSTTLTVTVTNATTGAVLPTGNIVLMWMAT